LFHFHSKQFWRDLWRPYFLTSALKTGGNYIFLYLDTGLTEQ